MFTSSPSSPLLQLRIVALKSDSLRRSRQVASVACDDGGIGTACVLQPIGSSTGWCRLCEATLGEGRGEGHLEAMVAGSLEEVD